ncbi:Metalloenzyme, LuxS/M16 peptidase-like protein [Bisporella sp. PMI_857]|nr:Metalloenzyme, LuxS/M16 peptidase-like protein [Bisporella sp. PMI_857]
MSQPQTPEDRRKSIRITDKLEIPSIDTRKYRVIRLHNQLEVLLVHDADTDMASAAMDVNVGDFSDDSDMPGLAHGKYPEENAYEQYLASHSGSSNAHTDATSTIYYFKIAAKRVEDATTTDTSPLYGALDRFAQFFISPLFLANTLDRELRAVDSEHNRHLRIDGWRLYQLEKSLSNPDHPYCHFPTGNYKVLKTDPEAKGIDVRQKFIEFHKKHYTANRMKLVVLGRESLDELESWVVDLFSGVENKNLEQNRWEDEVPFKPDDLLTQCFMKPVMNLNRLILGFPFIDEELLFESQPSRYISHLIGHEGPGSIMSHIKSRGWASGLYTNVLSVCLGTPGIFKCTIELTEDGLANYQEIVEVFFEYIALLKESPPASWIFEELKSLAEVEFKFRQKMQASKFTSKIAAVMQTPLPREWIISGLSRLGTFNPDRIKAGLACLRPDNFRMTVVSQKMPRSWKSKEKWYGTEYTYEKIPLDLIKKIEQAHSTTTKNRLAELHLPHKNPFIPTNLEIERKEIVEAALEPKLLRNDDKARIWFKKDDTFWVPKANLFVFLRNPLPSGTAENTLKARLYVNLVQDALEEYSYDAELAGLDYSIQSHLSGIKVTVSGYNDKLSVLLEKVLVTMRNLEVKPERFEIIKERVAKMSANVDLQAPYHRVDSYASWLNGEGGYLVEHWRPELPHIDAQNIQQFYPQLLRQIHIEILVHGNLYKEDALKLGDLVGTTLNPRLLPRTQWPISRNLIFPPGANFVYHKTLADPKDVNNCIEYLLTVGDISDRPLLAKTQLLDQMTHEPAFNQLRTKEQLGYIIISGMRGTSTTAGFKFIIQSERNCKYLEARIESFLASYRKTLGDMSEVEFEKHKMSLINSRLEKLNNLDQETNRFWEHISVESFDFDQVYQDAAQIKALSHDDMVKFYDTFIIPTSVTRSKLAIHLNSQVISLLDLEKSSAKEEVSDKGEGNGAIPFVITDVREFKSKMVVSRGLQAIRRINEFEEQDLGVKNSLIE